MRTHSGFGCGITANRFASSSQSAAEARRSRISSPRGQSRRMLFHHPGAGRGAGAALPGEDLAIADAAAPQPVRRLFRNAVGQEDEHETAGDSVGLAEDPGLADAQVLRTAQAHDALGIAVPEQHAGAVIGEIAVALARQGEALVPALGELVARGLRVGVAHLPEATDESALLVRARQGKKGRALRLCDQEGDIVEKTRRRRRSVASGRRFGRRLLGARRRHRAERGREEEGRQEPGAGGEGAKPAAKQARRSYRARRAARELDLRVVAAHRLGVEARAVDLDLDRRGKRFSRDGLVDW